MTAHRYTSTLSFRCPKPFYFSDSLHTLREQSLELLLLCAVLSLVAASLMASSVLSVHLRHSQQHAPSNRIGVCITIQMQSSQAKQAVLFKATGKVGCIKPDTVWALSDCWAPSESHFLEIKEGSGCVSVPTISEHIIKLTSNLYKIFFAGNALRTVKKYTIDILLEYTPAHVSYFDLLSYCIVGFSNKKNKSSKFHKLQVDIFVWTILDNVAQLYYL